jgi:hypothetical protein
MCLDAGHDVCQVRLGGLVVRLSPFLFTSEQAAPLHKSQMFGSHVAWNSACLGKFPDCVTAPQEHLDHAQPVRVGERLQAFGRLPQSVERGEPEQS